MNDHDGILTLLRLPDPAEKKLALKSKLVQPYHLRHALQDADPHVRAVAAGHPNLTKELMTEILSSDDKDLRHIVMARPDLQDEHLESMATHPDHAAEVAAHPRCTDDIRDLAIRSSQVPDSVKFQHHQNLSKSIGHITYPQLGEGKVYTKPMHQTKEQNGSRITYSGSPRELGLNTGGWLSHTEDREPLAPENRSMTGAVLTQDRPGSKETQGRLDETEPMERFLTAKKIDTGKTMAAVESHEAQHSVFARLGQKYGAEAKYRVVATTLARLPDDLRTHIANLYRLGGVSSGPAIDPEETIAYLHNYLQDPNFRNHIHQRGKITSKEEQRASVDRAREAWKHLRRIGLAMRPEDVGIEPEKYEDRVSKWVKTLVKRESIPSDQLGFSVSFLEMLAVCEFITQRQIDMQTIRQAIRTADDGLTGVLTAFGLNTPEGRQAFDSVKSLRLHKAEDILKAPKSVVGTDNPELAEVITRAYKHNKVESIALGGKHSGGSYIAKDDEGYNWLLKPGSGKKSPAAGVDETAGSQSRREALFAALGEWMGIDEVQPAGLLQIDGKEVACIRMWPMDWVNLHRTLAEDSNLPQRALEPYRRNGKIFKWAVLDFVAGNPDRHGNNLMVGPADEGNKVGLIDHGSALAGHGFDPGNDSDSFVPYYLRAWSGPNFHALSHAEQLKQMPELTGAADESLREWVAGLSPKQLESICHKYGMDPGPSLARLAEVQSDPMVEKVSVHINKLWLSPPPNPSRAE